MMKFNLSFAKQILINFLGLYTLLFFVRWLFYVVNKEFLEIDSSFDVFKACFYGLRFDTSSIFYINSLYILLMLIPFDFRFGQIYQKVVQRLFFFSNLIFIFIEIIDVFYFRYNLRRIIASDFILFKNALSHSGVLIFEYGIYVLIFGTIIFVLWKLFKRSNQIILKTSTKFLKQLGLFLVGMGLFVIGGRGGLQLRPISPIVAHKYVKNPSNAPLVFNAMQSLFLVVQQRALKEKRYWDKKELDGFYSKKMNGSTKELLPYNIVLIALEGIGNEYIQDSLDASSTPFLHGLLKDNLHVNSGFANGQRSTQGITSITTGLPNLMDDPFMFSAYQNNELIGLPGYLKKVDYNTSFYHGAYEGSMNFDQFTKSIGFDRYMDMVTYPESEKHFDGTWGIWDDPFFQYYIEELNKENEPFMSMVFTLTSHHPYAVEQWFEDKYPKMNPTLRAAKYLDYSLEKFFLEAQNQSWFDNTLFVICSDHIGLTLDKKYRNKVTKYGIPLIFQGSMVSDSMHISSIGSHIDILPSILDFINYPLDLNTFGQSVFDKLDEHHYTYMYDKGEYQILDETYILIFNDLREPRMYNYLKDTSLSKNLYKEKVSESQRLLNRLKAVIQTYHYDMIYNKLSK